jgi:hypothetical protein
MAQVNVISGQAPAGETIGDSPRFEELSIVSVCHPVEVNGRILPAGTKGTVVAAYSDGIGYEVEVFEPFHAVITLKAGDFSE